MVMYQNYKQNTRRTLKTQDIHYNKANQEWSRVSEHMDINAHVICVQCLDFNYVFPCENAIKMLMGLKGPFRSFM